MESLSGFENKRVRIVTEDGLVFTGVAEVYPSGYGIHEFGRAEKSVLISGTQIFSSDIRKVEVLSESSRPGLTTEQLNEMMGELLEGPYRIVDVFPERVPACAASRYFAVERYYLQPERIRKLRRKYAEILMRMNCYDDMMVSFDSCESWERNPDPEVFAEELEGLSGNGFLRAVFEAHRVMADIEPDDTYMTVYDPECVLTDRLRKLVAAEGLFVWEGRDGQ